MRLFVWVFGFGLVLAACVSDDEAGPEVGASTTVDFFSTLPPPAVLPTQEWPASPEVGIWYRLTLRGVWQCGLAWFSDPPVPPPGIAYRSVAGEMDRLLASEVWAREENSNIEGYGRMTAEGDLEFSMDTVNGRTIYAATPAEERPGCS